MLKRNILLIFSILMASACGDQKNQLFNKADSFTTGITFKNILTVTDEFNIIDYLYFYNGGGVAVGDINHDGLPDIYFSGNQVTNKLYLNKGNLQFEDITESAGVAGNSQWNTGAVMGDVNGDGLLDIYVCAVVGLRGLSGHNELFINNGDNTFTESAGKYGLDFDTYSSSAAFLDYDLDGDLDIYLLNHAVHTQESFGNAELRNRRNYETGDRLLRNDGGKFTDVSEEAGIYGGVNSYGLGIAVSDFNQDGYPDVYIGNDFHEDDYYYLNNGDGTFAESLKQYFGHTTRFSMGNDVADINHDGFPDIMSLDMLPEDEKVLKSSEGDDDLNIMRLKTGRYGYHYQYTRNMLQLNRGEGNMFVETALMSGVAATDWSWSVLFADYNQDGEQDIFISNGIPKRPNDLDYIKFVSNDQIKNKIEDTKLVDRQALDLMPSGEVNNYIFSGNGDLSFEDMTSDWIPKESCYSGATALSDLDNDGDLDIVISNLGIEPSIYVNQTNAKSSYLKLSFDYLPINKFGVGSKVFAYNKGAIQFKELYTVRGFQSSSEPIVHFGFGKERTLDSLKIIWPNGKTQVMNEIALNKHLVIRYDETITKEPDTNQSISDALFERVSNNLGIQFTHKEDRYIDFDRQKLMPYQISDRGPATALGDINNDSKEDVYFGGSKFESSKIYLQSDTGFVLTRIPELQKDSVKEEVVASIADYNNDNKSDLIVGSGGADFFNKMKPLLDSYYVGDGFGFSMRDFPAFFENASVIAPCDYDNDGDLDVFIGSSAVSNDFGRIPKSVLLNNENGAFGLVVNEALERAGMLTDALWYDLDNNGNKDLIVVGEWMSPKVFFNVSGVLKEVEIIDKLNGLWRSVDVFDADFDGDMDIVLGNWGLNSKFKASQEKPMRMFYSDFDDNGSTETIVATEKDGKYYTLFGLDELAGQMVSLRKKFTSYKSFAGQPIEKVFDRSLLNEAVLHEVHQLASGYLKNEDGNYEFVAWPNQLQVAPITSILVHDLDGDDNDELLLGGNYLGVKPFHGRFDSFSGAVIDAENGIKMGDELGLNVMNCSVRDLNILNFKGADYLLVTINNEAAQVYQLVK